MTSPKKIPPAVPLCPACLGKIGGAAGAPDFPYRAAEDFERCGAGDCETGKTHAEDPYVCRKCGGNDPRTIEVGESSASLEMDLGRTDCGATSYPEGVNICDVEWVTVGVYCPDCMTEIRGDDFEAEPLVFALRRLFVLESRRAPKGTS